MSATQTPTPMDSLSVESSVSTAPGVSLLVLQLQSEANNFRSAPPVLDVNADDTVRIHVVSRLNIRFITQLTFPLPQYNGLDEPTAIHHHVRFQPS